MEAGMTAHGPSVAALVVRLNSLDWLLDKVVEKVLPLIRKHSRVAISSGAEEEEEEEEEEDEESSDEEVEGSRAEDRMTDAITAAVRHCPCPVYLLPAWLRHCPCPVFPLPAWLRHYPCPVVLRWRL